MKSDIDYESYQSQARPEHCVVMSNETVSRHYKVFIDNGVDEPSYYREALVTLEAAGEDDVVEFVINTHGGFVMTLASILDAIKHTKATTIGTLSGIAYSAGGAMFLSCDLHRVSEFSSMMVHSTICSSAGTAGNVLNRAKMEKNISDTLVDKVYKGFLSPAEVVSIKNSEEIWLTSDEIIDRLAKMYKQREKDSKAMIRSVKLAAKTESEQNT